MSTQRAHKFLPLPPEDVARIRELRADGYSIRHVAQVVGCRHGTVAYHAPGDVGALRREVPVAPLREAFERSGLSGADVARALGWYDHHGRADGHRVRRALGIRPVDFGRGLGLKLVRSTTYERALQLADAIGVDPVDVGL